MGSLGDFCLSDWFGSTLTVHVHLFAQKFDETSCSVVLQSLPLCEDLWLHSEQDPR